jgi:pyruvate/2-oxoglutarate dehydrogenase complex dihydrolipoamide acyltransferase (E2) component
MPENPKYRPALIVAEHKYATLVVIMSDFDDWLARNNTARPDSNSVGIAPLAKRIAEENHLDWQNMTGTGKNGLIIERDVLMAVAQKRK